MDSSPSMLCIGLHLIAIENRASLVNSTSQNKNLIACVATSTLIFLIDLNASHLIYLIDFKNMPYNSKHLNVNYLLPQIVEFSLVNGKQINAALHSIFQNEIDVIKCADLFIEEVYNEDKNSNIKSLLSVLPR